MRIAQDQPEGASFSKWRSPQGSEEVQDMYKVGALARFFVQMILPCLFSKFGRVCLHPTLTSVIFVIELVLDAMNCSSCISGK